MHDLNQQHQNTPAKPFTRRSVVRAAAWSVPAVSVAAAAPSFAVSPGTGPLTSLQVALGADTSALIRVQLGLNNPTLLQSSLIPNGPNLFTVTNTTANPIVGATANVSINFNSAFINLGGAPGIAVASATQVGGGSAVVTHASNQLVTEEYLDGILDLIYFSTYNTSATITLPTLAPGDTQFDLGYALTDIPAISSGISGVVLAAIIALLPNGGVGVFPKYDITITLAHSSLTGAAPSDTKAITALADIAAGLNPA